MAPSTAAFLCLAVAGPHCLRRNPIPHAGSRDYPALNRAKTEYPYLSKTKYVPFLKQEQASSTVKCNSTAVNP